MAAAAFINSISTGNHDTSSNSTEIVGSMSLLWQEKAIKSIFEHRASKSVHSQLDDSTEYFFNNIKRICDKDYVASDEDIILINDKDFVRKGITHAKFEIRDSTYDIINVEQSNERRKWIHFFDSVSGVMFVASLSSYNEWIIDKTVSNEKDGVMRLFRSGSKYSGGNYYDNMESKDNYNENDNINTMMSSNNNNNGGGSGSGGGGGDSSITYKNAMIESINLFDETFNSRWFRGDRIPLVLWLNKCDLFRDKLTKYPLTICFPDYDGDNSYDNCVEYVRQEYESKNQNPETKNIYTHYTTATDEDNVSKVFNDVQHIVINSSLRMCVLQFSEISCFF